MTRAKLRKLLTTPGWRWGTWEGAELHTLLLGLLTTFREKLEWLEEAETLSLQMRASREKQDVGKQKRITRSLTTGEKLKR